MNQRTIPVGWELFFKFATEMVMGLSYLHSFNPSIVHRDMKSLNVMIDEEWTVKLIDFGQLKIQVEC